MAEDACLNRPQNKVLLKTATMCFENGVRLLEETYDLEFRKIIATCYYMAKISQEEFAKAFMLLLIRDDVVPFSLPVLRAMNDHSSKQLIGMIMDYMIMHWEELDELKAMIEADSELGDRFPNDVGSALEILRYEKIGRWESAAWCWDEDPKYDRMAQAVADGKRDREKQDALYVRIGRDGRAASLPEHISLSKTKAELERADRYKTLIQSALDGGSQSYRYNKVIAALRLLF